ncbi:MAG TPA: hypothetical protein G4O15_04470, partial [Dehalococcoidia bacterium]|nr:hypothetical protein [Dehalococcoidia bacterium]
SKDYQFRVDNAATDINGIVSCVGTLARSLDPASKTADAVAGIQITESINDNLMII